jgi:hypothetical protein
MNELWLVTFYLLTIFVDHMRDALAGSTLPATNETKIYASSPISQPVYGQPSF